MERKNGKKKEKKKKLEIFFPLKGGAMPIHLGTRNSIETRKSMKSRVSLSQTLLKEASSDSYIPEASFCLVYISLVGRGVHMLPRHSGNSFLARRKCLGLCRGEAKSPFLRSLGQTHHFICHLVKVVRTWEAARKKQSSWISCSVQHPSEDRSANSSHGIWTSFAFG